MVQLTIDNVTMQIQSPKSDITTLQARPRVPFVLDVPCVPDVSDVSNVRVVRDVSVVRDVRGVSANARCPKRNRTQPKRHPEFSKAGTRNSGAFQAFQPFQAFHFFHSFQPFQKRAVSEKNETPDRNCIREFVLKFFYGFIW